MNKIIILCALMISGAMTQADATVDQAPKACTLTTAASARVAASPCFSDLQSIIACMPPAEQDVWASVNAKNTDNTLCFDCSNIQANVKDGMKKNANANGKKFGESLTNKRKGVSCFKGVFNKLDSTTQTQVDNQLKAIVSNQQQESQCQTDILKNGGNRLIIKRKLLCAPIEKIKQMAVVDTNGKITDLKFTVEEANEIVNEFLNFFECKASMQATVANAVSTMTDLIANSPNCVASTRILQPAQGSPNQPKKPAPKGKALGTDVQTYITALSGLSTSFTDSNFADVVTQVTSQFSSSNAVSCNPGGFQKLMTNINNSDVNLGVMLKLIGQVRGRCPKDSFALYIKNGQVSCTGTCTISPFTLTFRDSTKVPSNYFAAFGCSQSGSFHFNTYTDLADTSIVYSTFIFNGPNLKFNSDERCLKKAAGCVPGGARAGTTTDGACAQIKPECGDKLNQKCAEMGLMQVVKVKASSSPYPGPCDYITQEVEKTNTDFITNCFLFIKNKFLRKSINLNPETLAAPEDVLAITTTSPTSLRVLADSDIVVSTDLAAGSYRADFNTATLSSADISVSTTSVNDAMNDINLTGSGSIYKFSIGFMIAVFALLI